MTNVLFSRSFSRALLALLLVWTVAMSGPMVGAQTIPPERLEQWQALSESQRQAILRSLNGNQRGARPASPANDAASETMPDAMTPVPEDQEPLQPDGLKPRDALAIGLLMAPEDARKIEHEGLSAAVGTRVYELDDAGFITLPKVGKVFLAGLNPDQVVLRLQSEPALRDFEITASLLPFASTGEASLEPFGYDLFRGGPSSFLPAAQLPVPTDYVLGAGDRIRVTLFGSTNSEFTLEVGRDGQVILPDSGPVSVAGLTFQQMRDELTRRIEAQGIGVKSAISMGELRTIQVFVLGAVERPGTYTVNGLSTMTHAIFASGGLLTSGSMRDVQLKRNNRIRRRLDLYDVLLRGNTAADVRLSSGDVIFVPSVGPRVSVLGEVLRPAIYEIKGESSAAEVFELAGGLLPTAFAQSIHVQRYAQNGDRTLINFPATAAGTTTLRGGDVVEVMSALDDVVNSVRLMGHVQREYSAQWRTGLRLTDVISSVQQLKPGADQNYVLIHRRDPETLLSRLLSASLRDALDNPGTWMDPVLTPRDEIMVLASSRDRAASIAPLLDRLRQQARSGEPAPIATVVGPVVSPGEYPLQPGMRVKDLVRAAGGLLESAYSERLELTRQVLEQPEAVGGGLSAPRRTTTHQFVTIAESGDVDSNPLLRPYDFLTVREIPQWRNQETVLLEGEVRFPGIYAVRRGEYLSDVIQRAGGLTSYAFAEGSVFLRSELREREEEQLERLADRVRSEISSMPVDQAQQRSLAEQILVQIESSEPVGRLVIDLDGLLSRPANNAVDILVKDGDRLLIPTRSQEVTVIGEVQYATSHIYTPGLDRQGYILNSGGVTANADVGRIYVVRSNGNVVASSRSRWFGQRGANLEIRPGDTIVVPLDADRVSALSLWSSVTQIVYNIGVAAAAVASF